MIIQGDCLEKLKELEDESIDCVITSPPYWALRKYGDNPNELGTEKTFQEYISKLVEIFNEVKRVLKKEGTCWVNLGDTYNSHSTGKGNVGGIEGRRKNKQDNIANTKKSFGQLPDKCLACIPDRFKIAMVDNGWICRNDIIWYKRNCMPSSAKDRFTVDYERIFFFVKSKKYYFEQQFEERITNPEKDLERIRNQQSGNNKHNVGGIMSFHNTLTDEEILERASKGRNMRSVWDIPTKPSSIPHFAMYPETLVARMIKAGCPEKGIVLDPFMGAGNTLTCAKKLNRQGIGIELYEKYIKIAEARIKGLEKEPNQTQLL